MKLSILSLMFSLSSMSVYGTTYISDSDKEAEFSLFSINQQIKKVKGVVVDVDGIPVIGANVIVTGTSKGTITDMDGRFVIEASVGSTLEISYLGYATKSIKVGNKDIVSVILEENSEALEEVVVVGYGTQRKVNLTGAVSQVSSEVLEDKPIVNLSQGLQGVIPNMNVSFSSGKPGATGNIDIRGVSSINSSSPLVLIDGVAMSLNSVNPEDVASISVLKDAASAAIYGARGSAGVILITTKKGKSKKTVIQYSGNVQFNNPTYIPEVVDSYDFAMSVNEAYKNYTGNVKFTDEQVEWIKAYRDDPINNPVYHMLPNGKIFWNGNSNGFDQMLQNWAPTHKHTLSLNGGGEKVNYYVSAGYLHQDGSFVGKTDSYAKYNFLANLNANVTNNLKVGFKASYTNNVTDEPLTPYNGSSYANWWEMITRHPILIPIMTPEDFPGGVQPTKNTYNFLTSGSNNTNYSDVMLLSGNLEWQVFKGLTLKGDFSYRSGNSRTKKFQKTFYYINDRLTPENAMCNPSFIETSHNHTDYFAANIYGEYNTTINKKHNFTLLGGFNQEWSESRTDYARREGLLSQNVPSMSLSYGDVKVTDTESDWAVRGVFGRFKYDFENKYLFEMNARYDGTSKFPYNSRYGFFPSFSGGWRISQEKFMQSTSNWLSDLKLRASYGSLGNQNVSGNYPFLTFFGVTPQTSYLIDGKRPISVTPPGLSAASNITWETVKTFDVGLDLTLLNRLTANFDYYVRNTYDMLVAGEKLPSVIGTGVPQRNNANMRTNGWELTLNWHDRTEFGLDYNLTFVMSDYKRVITKYDNNPTGLRTTYYVGKELGEIWGYETEGIFQTPEEVANAADQSKLGNGDKWAPGDTHYKDLNGDGVIDWGDNTLENPGDMKIIGNSTPRYQFGFTADLKWKGFDFSMFIQGVGKKDFFPTGKLFWGNMYAGANAVSVYDVWEDSWREDNTDAFYPIWETNSFGYNLRNQTRYLANGAYARLKNLTFGYTLPQNLTQRFKLNKVRIYFSGQNLAEISAAYIKHFDPEVTGSMGQYYPLQRTISFGLQLSL